ncbi:Uncharacterised protein [Bordetella pertussis]|nr:Uncharacterised protein [Bordetella pertussis]CFP63943.1 Uncharacterised protein [Bordetella pertussis]
MNLPVSGTASFSTLNTTRSMNGVGLPQSASRPSARSCGSPSHG